MKKWIIQSLVILACTLPAFACYGMESLKCSYDANIRNARATAVAMQDQKLLIELEEKLKAQKNTDENNSIARFKVTVTQAIVVCLQQNSTDPLNNLGIAARDAGYPQICLDLITQELQTLSETLMTEYYEKLRIELDKIGNNIVELQQKKESLLKSVAEHAQKKEELDFQVAYIDLLIKQYHIEDACNAKDATRAQQLLDEFDELTESFPTKYQDTDDRDTMVWLHITRIELEEIVQKCIKDAKVQEEKSSAHDKPTTIAENIENKHTERG